jgi:hypothetical protein
MLAYVQGVLWQQNVANTWYSRVSGGWSAGTISPLLGYPLYLFIYLFILGQYDTSNASFILFSFFLFFFFPFESFFYAYFYFDLGKEII